MHYDPQQVDLIMQELKKKTDLNELENVNLVTVLVSLKRLGRVSENDILYILKGVFDHDPSRILPVLNRARSLVDADLIDDIIKDFHSNH